MKKTECFKIQIAKNRMDQDIFDFTSHEKILTIECDSMGICALPKTILADPFLFVHNNKLYLFFESKLYGQDAVLSMISTNDCKHWTEPCVVLKEKCHLSYPFVFEDEGTVYMVPETCAMNEIRLYKANEDLTSFVYDSTLMLDNEQRKNFSFSDTSIYRKGNTYYLMTTINDGGNTLKLFYSDNLKGQYKEHKQSPIVNSNKNGRNAGAIIEYKHELYRVAQDCEAGYGENIHLYQISKLTINEYEEKLIKENLLDRTRKFYKYGGHQFNYVQFNGWNIIATDAKEYHYFLLQKLLRKFKLW